jgi:regulator of replication initiation timing
LCGRIRSLTRQLEEVVAELLAEVERLRVDSGRLRAENAELRRRLGLKSSNSSK